MAARGAVRSNDALHMNTMVIVQRTGIGQLLHPQIIGLKLTWDRRKRNLSQK